MQCKRLNGALGDNVMVFSKGFVACIKVDGNILREVDDTVSLPFSSEYSVLLKNLHSVRAKVKVSVDGKDITEGTSLIVPANGSVNLERFIRAGNMEAGNKFKFIERTAGIEEHRGIGSDDGLVRIEYWLEEQKPITQTITTVHEHIHRYRSRPYYRPFYTPYYDYDPYYPPYTIGPSIAMGFNVSSTMNTAASFSDTKSYNSSGMGPNRPSSGLGSKGKTPLRSLRATMSASGPRGSAGMPLRASAAASRAPINDAGITVPGGESQQKFTNAGWFPTEAQSHVIVIKLRGVVAGKTVKKPVTVKSKPTCETCGKVNKATEKFCGQCGTALILI